MVGARTLAMGLNRVIDARDRRAQPAHRDRASCRPGKVAPAQVWLLCAASLALLVAATFQLDPITRVLWPIPVALFVLYPYTKRFTWLCHLVLGLSIGLAPLGAWLATGAPGDELAPYLLWLGIAALDRRLRRDLRDRRRGVRPRATASSRCRRASASPARSRSCASRTRARSPRSRAPRSSSSSASPRGSASRSPRRCSHGRTRSSRPTTCRASTRRSSPSTAGSASRSAAASSSPRSCARRAVPWRRRRATLLAGAQAAVVGDVERPGAMPGQAVGLLQHVSGRRVEPRPRWSGRSSRRAAACAPASWRSPIGVARPSTRTRR